MSTLNTIELVKVIRYEDETKDIPLEEQKWCMSENITGTLMALCSLQVLGFGEGSAVYETKSVKNFRGNVCQDCLQKIKNYKSIPL